MDEPPLSALRRQLEVDPGASLAGLAHNLGMSRRTLQRTLAEVGTTLSRERDGLRRTLAIDLLRAGVKLDAIAAAIGCADRRSLNRLFRRVTGESPSAFRARALAPLHRASFDDPLRG
jgi:AraC-like DNA-binding protein